MTLEPLGEQKRGEREDSDEDGEDQPDDVLGVHRSNILWTKPSSAKIASVSKTNTTMDISTPFEALGERARRMSQRLP
jgi:hypothetical protein